MSISEPNPADGSRESETSCAAVLRVITPKEKDIGGFIARRSLPFFKQRSVGPWVFFDHFGPTAFPADDGMDVRPHPHISLATVTYLFEGEIMHRDSTGAVQAVSPGAVNLMVAGRGVTHSERSPDDLREAGHRLHGVQLWLALPEKDEEMEAVFFHHAAAELPSATHGGCEIRVMMGEAFGLTSPVKTYSPTLFAEALIHRGSHLVAPQAPERAVYVASGSIGIDGHRFPAHTLLVLSPRDEIRLHAQEDSRIVLIGGESLGHRNMWWNFISSNKARIEQAKADWRNGRFPRIPGDDDEYMPLPE